MQNITRDMEINNKLKETRGKGEGNNGGKKGKGCQGTCRKNPWTKPKVGTIEGDRQGCVGQGKIVRGNGDNCTQTIIKNAK